MTSPDSGRLRLAFIVLTLIWGSTWAVIRLGLEGIPPLTGVALRFAIAGAILLALVPRLGVRFTWSREELGLWAMNGLLSFSASYTIVYWAEQHIPSGLAALLFATYPLFVAVLAHFFLPGERLGWSSAVGILLGFAGVGVIFSDDLHLLGGANVRAGGPGHAPLAHRLRGGDRRGQALGSRDPPPVAHRGPHAPDRGGRGRPGLRLRAARPGGLRPPLGGGARCTWRSSARR